MTPSRARIEDKTLTELDRAGLNDKIGGVRLVVDLLRLAEQLQETLGVNEGLVNCAVQVAEHVQGAVELREVRDEEHELMRFRLAPHDTHGDNHRSDEETKSLSMTGQFGTLAVFAKALTMMKFWTRLRRLSETIISLVRGGATGYGAKLTHHPVFEALVLANGLAVALTLMLLSVEVFHSLVVKQAVGMNTTDGHITVVHRAPELRAPSGKHNACRHCSSTHERRIYACVSRSHSP